MDGKKPYSQEDYDIAKLQGLDLDNWNDYVTFFEIGTNEEDNWWKE